MSEERKGNWMQVRSGGKFWLEDPRAEEVNLKDIGWALSSLCRFTGHVEFYSVAQHCVHVAGLLPPELKLHGLLHDAAEAYLGDLSRPLRRVAGLGEIVQGLEDGIMGAVSEAFGVPDLWPMPAAVKEADDVMLATEKLYLLRPCDWGVELPAPAARYERLSFWSPWDARDQWMNRVSEALRVLHGEMPRRAM